MKKYFCYIITTSLLVLIGSPSILRAQTVSRKVFPSSGGLASASNGSLTWTLGETFQQTLISGNRILTQGFQQPEADVVSIDLSLFIQGFYQGSGVMAASVNALAYPTLSDTIVVELASAETPNTILFSQTTTLSTTGLASVTFPGIVQGHPYYIVIRHRNSIETWSAVPLSLALPKAEYNFSISASSAFGANLADLGDGHFALWSGDVNQDDAVDSLDHVMMESAVHSFLNGYYSEDLNADGLMEAADFSLMENNFLLPVVRVRP